MSSTPIAERREKSSARALVALLKATGRGSTRARAQLRRLWPWAEGLDLAQVRGQPRDTPRCPGLPPANR